MGELSKKIKKAAIAGAALYAANKAMTGSIGAKSLQGDKFAKARKLMTSNQAMRGQPGMISKTMGMGRKKSTIARLQDESLTQLNPRTRIGSLNRMKLWQARKEKAAAIAKAKPTRTYPGATGGRGIRRAKGGITKARGGVMVNTKLNGKLYTETF